MPFNINEFKSVMNKYGGPAKNNLFVVTFAWRNKITGSTQQGRKTEYMPEYDIRFFCREINIPALNANVFAYQANSIGIPQNMPINLTTPSINATFMLDSDHRVISFFHSWMQEIINYDTSGGLLSSVRGNHMPYEIGYKDEYTCTMTIEHYKTDTQSETDFAVYSYRFNSVYPTEVSGRILSWATDDNVATIGVNFTASSFSFTGSETGQINSNLSRGNGYLEFLNSVGYRGQTIQQNNLPTSIQDAINTFTSIRNDFGSIKNTFRSLTNIF